MVRVFLRAALTVVVCLALLAAAMRLASLARVQFAAGDASTGLVFALGSVAALAVIIAVVGFVRRRSRPVGDQPRGQPSNWRWGQGGT